VSLPERLFSNFSGLQHLHISFTSLVNLSIETFQGLETTLKTLSVVNSKLKEIPQQALNKLKNLETLDLESNDMVEIDSYSLYGLPLVSLNLQSNKINTLLEFSFGGLENTLEELVLINNKLEQFPLQALRRLRKLQILKLQSNQISQIPDDGFTRFTVLTNLDLQSNRIDHLDSRSFITMPKLVSLSLSNNQLTILSDNSIFVHLIDLETLDLSLNNLRIVDLNNLSSLRTLDLSNNHLHDIQFHNLPNLKELFVSHNNILKLTNETFINTTSLSVLYLQHNAIHSISHNTFHSLHNLFTLDLSYNELKEIHSTLFKYSNKLQSLYLDNNLIVDTGLEAGTFQELV
jgi:Leucine-rich repeat (LRR) protein